MKTYFFHNMDPVTVAYVVCLIISELLPHISNHQVNGFLHIILLGIQTMFKISPKNPPLSVQVDTPEPKSPSTVVDIQKM